MSDECHECHGEGTSDGESYCECQAGEALYRQGLAEHAYMAPMVARANRARRDGDEAEYQRIRQEAIR